MVKNKEIDDSSWPNTVNHNVFLTLLKFNFPEIYEEVEDGSANLLHVVMGNFRRIVEENLLLREKNTRLYLVFLSKVLARADSEVLNAIELSFLYGFPEKKEDKEIASKWMPDNLKKAKNNLRKKLSG